MNQNAKQLWALVQSMPPLPQNGVKEPIFLCSSNSLPSFNNRLKTSYYPSALKELENQENLIWWLTIHASDSPFSMISVHVTSLTNE